MNRFLFLITFLGSITSWCAPNYKQKIIGTWFFESYRYQDQVFERPNPYLHIYYSFAEDQTSRLHWTRINENGFCERYAKYEWIDQHLYEFITWVNPNNNPDCASDPDMQPGNRNRLDIKWVNADQFELRVQAGDNDIWYIWTRQPDYLPLKRISPKNH